MPARIHKARENFEKIGAKKELVDGAIENLKYWLLHPDFEEYHGQVEYLINSEQYDELFDCFYQVIPFGTAGRRGLVGVGPNRMNPWTIATSAQGHSQYILKKHGDEAKKRGLAIAYDVRQFTDHRKVYDSSQPNPLWGVTSKELAQIAASIYAKNGIKVHFFQDVRSTPQLSFTIRKLNAIGGINISASHNPPDYNGKKVYDETGGQLLAPFDQELADEVSNNVSSDDIDWGIFKSGLNDKKIQIVAPEIEDAYIAQYKNISISKNRSARIFFSPLHGTGKSSVYKMMKQGGFDIHMDAESSIPSGEFETVPGHSANPLLPIVYERLKPFAEAIDSDIIITSDPDADRMGALAKNKEDEWEFIDGNQTVVLLSYFILTTLKKKKKLIKTSTIYTSAPVVKLVGTLCEKFGVEFKGDSPPGFKYFGEILNELEDAGNIKNFLLAAEDTLGHSVGNYSREKDAAAGSILLSEYAGELKDQDKTLFDALDEIYSEYGYFKNVVDSKYFDFGFETYLINDIVQKLRDTKCKSLKGLEITSYKDYWDTAPIISETDKSSRNLVEFEVKPSDDISSVRVIIRPSGTEPKLKIYIEVSKTDDLTDMVWTKHVVDEEIERVLKLIKDGISI